jgi:hypothetical protein
MVGIHDGLPHPLKRSVDLDLRVDGAHFAADTNGDGHPASQPAHLGGLAIARAGR